MFRRHHLFASLSVALVTAVCIASSGCSDPEQATPRVIFTSEIAGGSHPASECGKSGLSLEIGSFGNPGLGRTSDDPDAPFIDPARPIDDGSQDQQGSVLLNCSVTAAGDGFDVKAHAELSGAGGGAVTISGHFGPGGDQPNIAMSLSQGGEGYNDTNCTATYDVAAGQGVAPGRVWATIDCPNAENASALRTCESKAQFRFENCAQ
jgi:hypothetical protein